MNPRSPAEFYLKYLIVHPDKYSDDTIEGVLNEVGIYHLGSEYIQRLRSRCIPPDPFDPMTPEHRASHRFLLREGIRSMFFQDQHTKLALRILEMPRVKEFVETMILSHAPALAIARRVTATHMFCTVQAVEEYKKYFWNIDLLSTTQLRMLLHMEFDQNIADSDSQKTKEGKRALKKASYMDPRKLAADLPYSPMTALMAQMRMGVMPNKLELAKILMSTQAVASVKVLEACLYGSDRDSSRALNYSIVAKNSTEMLESVVKPDEHLREQLQAIALRTESAPVPSIHELSAGQHTVDLQPANLQVEHEPVLEEGDDGDIDGGMGEG